MDGKAVLLWNLGPLEKNGKLFNLEPKTSWIRAWMDKSLAIKKSEKSQPIQDFQNPHLTNRLNFFYKFPNFQIPYPW
jgi:hypothetical protein